MVIVRYFGLAFFILIFSACSIFDKPEEIPAYLTINLPTVNTDEITQGANTHNIVDGWVYVNDEPIGVLELPATIPILNKGKVSIDVFAGVKNNGFEAQRENYPFYRAYSVDTVLVAKETVTLNPTFEYKADANFLLNEDFEGLDIGLDSSQFSLGNAVFNSQVVRSGVASAHIKLSEDRFYAEVVTKEKVVLPKLGQPIYCELDYNCDVDFEVRLISNNPNGSIYRDQIIILKSTQGNWNKVYIDLAVPVSNSQQADTYQLGFECDLINNPREANIYLDNLKIIAD